MGGGALQIGAITRLNERRLASTDVVHSSTSQTRVVEAVVGCGAVEDPVGNDYTGM